MSVSRVGSSAMRRVRKRLGDKVEIKVEVKGRV